MNQPWRMNLIRNLTVFLLILVSLTVYAQPDLSSPVTGQNAQRDLDPPVPGQNTRPDLDSPISGQDIHRPELDPHRPELNVRNPEPFGSRLKILFTGDIMGHDTQIAAALAAGDSVYNYHPGFMHLSPYFNSADLVIGNLEVTLAGPPYKGYPRFSSPDELADALKAAGFNILLTANNHSMDRGRQGLERTLLQLDQRGIISTGTFADALSRTRYYPLLVEKNGILLAILNYTYGTNGINVDPPAVVNPIDTALIRKDLQKAALARPDFIIVNLHWGREYERTEHYSQRDLARFLFGHGADVIIGSHPHVVQPVRGSGKGDLVVYSLGNFISNQRDRYRDGGIVFELQLEKEGDSTRIVSHGYLPVWVYKPKTPRGTIFTLLPAAIAADTTVVSSLGMGEADKRKMGQFLMDTRLHLSGQSEIEPYWMQPDDQKPASVSTLIEEDALPESR